MDFPQLFVTDSSSAKTPVTGRDARDDLPTLLYKDRIGRDCRAAKVRRSKKPEGLRTCPQQLLVASEHLRFNFFRTQSAEVRVVLSVDEHIVAIELNGPDDVLIVFHAGSGHESFLNREAKGKRIFFSQDQISKMRVPDLSFPRRKKPARTGRPALFLIPRSCLVYKALTAGQVHRRKRS